MKVYNRWYLAAIGDGGSYYIRRASKYCWRLGVRLSSGIVLTGKRDGYATEQEAEKEARAYATA